MNATEIVGTIMAEFIDNVRTGESEDHYLGSLSKPAARKKESPEWTNKAARR
jgi:hypothetical protein